MASQSSGLASQIGTAAAGAAMKNPVFMQSFTNAMFSKLTTNDIETDTINFQDPSHDNSIDVDDEEFEQIKMWHRRLRLYYIATASLMISTSLLSFVSITLLTAGFLAFYVFMFGCLLCCFNVGTRQSMINIC